MYLLVYDMQFDCFFVYAHKENKNKIYHWLNPLTCSQKWILFFGISDETCTPRPPLWIVLNFGTIHRVLETQHKKLLKSFSNLPYKIWELIFSNWSKMAWHHISHKGSLRFTKAMVVSPHQVVVSTVSHRGVTFRIIDFGGFGRFWKPSRGPISKIAKISPLWWGILPPAGGIPPIPPWLWLMFY